MSDLALSPRTDLAANDVLRVGPDASRGRLGVAVLAAAACAGLLLLTPLYIELTIAIAVLVGTMTWVIDGSIVAGRTVRIEGQLADALDLLGSSVAAGVGLGAVTSAEQAVGSVDTHTVTPATP